MWSKYAIAMSIGRSSWPARSLPARSSTTSSHSAAPRGLLAPNTACSPSIRSSTTPSVAAGRRQRAHHHRELECKRHEMDAAGRRAGRPTDQARRQAAGQSPRRRLLQRCATAIRRHLAVPRPDCRHLPGRDAADAPRSRPERGACGRSRWRCGRLRDPLARIRRVSGCTSRKCCS